MKRAHPVKFFSRLRIFTFERMPIRQHALVKNSDNQNAALHTPIKDYVSPLLESMQPWTDPIARSAESRIPRERLDTVFQCVEIAFGLRLAPGLQRVRADIQQIGLRAA